MTAPASSLDNIRLLGENGLMGIEVPTEWRCGHGPGCVRAGDGGGRRRRQPIRPSCRSTILFCNGILTHGTEQQKQTYVRIAEGTAIGVSR